MAGNNFDPAAAVDALAALLSTPCPWWCDHTAEGHQWEDDGADGYWRTHARLVGPFTVVAAERINPDGSTELDGVGVETHLDDFDDAEEARRLCRRPDGGCSGVGCDRGRQRHRRTGHLIPLWHRLTKAARSRCAFLYWAKSRGGGPTTR